MPNETNENKEIPDGKKNETNQISPNKHASIVTETKPDGSPSPKKAKLMSNSIMDFLKSGQIKINYLKDFKKTHVERNTLRAAVAALSAEMPEDYMVTKSRRRITLIDFTGMITGYCHLIPFEAVIGDILSLSYFKVEKGRVTIFATSTVARGPSMKIDDKSLQDAASLIQEPLTAFKTIGSILGDTTKSKDPISCSGEVTRITPKTTVPSKSYGGRDGMSLRIQLDLEDPIHNDKILVTLYDEAALHIIKIGTTLSVHDSPIYINSTTGTKFITVYNADNILQSPPKALQEEIMIVGVESSQLPNTLILNIENKGKSRRRAVKREPFLTNLNEPYCKWSDDKLRKLCPMYAKSYSVGEDIQHIVVHKISTPIQPESTAIDFSAIFRQQQNEQLDQEQILRALEEDFEDTEN